MARCYLQIAHVWDEIDQATCISGRSQMIVRATDNQSGFVDAHRLGFLRPCHKQFNLPRQSVPAILSSNFLNVLLARKSEVSR